LHESQREKNLDKRRGHRPRLQAPGTGRRPLLTLADRLLATVLHHRLGLPQVAIATLFGVCPETINRRIRDIRQLLKTMDHTITAAGCQLTTLQHPYDHASAVGITLPPEIKTAS
ncbi:transposase family protein, partial [Streptomyces sp. NPDC098789]|uniref:transposase family protein n=1 Tax=Streptomyces sp. NPDC098789 TaxID=3366098 RepID=UPI0038086CEE